ncbi:MAG: hypothetical protein AAGA93_23075 [Actinomycetota bacterium]
MALDSVYLAARFERRDELNGYRAELEAAGLEVTSRWLTDPTPELTDEAWRQLAAKDVEDIRRAGGLVLFAESGGSGGGGRQVEFGVALGFGKRLIVVGEPENLFHRLAEVEVVPTWDAAVTAIVA